MKTCTQCRRAKPPADFVAGKARRIASNCAACRKANSTRHRRKYYAGLSRDKQHELTHRARAQSYGVEHVPYSRSAVLARWGHTCAYCSAPAEHLDHVQPLSKGGADVESNILPACVACNLGKGAKTLSEWALSTFAPPF